MRYGLAQFMKHKKKPKHEFPRLEKKDYLIIAGSGPSAMGFPHADIATKKMSCPADYQAARHQAWAYKIKAALKAKTKPDDRYKFGPEKGFLLYKNHPTNTDKYPIQNIKNCHICDWKFWDSYFLSFGPKNRNKKPSVGLCAFMMAYELWKPEKVGLIGFDWVLDGYKGWLHDSFTELRVMESLCEVEDLREA
jgi:hypothetical protein